MQNKTLLFVFIAFLLLMITSCVKNCKCTEYDNLGNKTGATIDRPLPTGYGLSCSDVSDSLAIEGGGGYICK